MKLWPREGQRVAQAHTASQHENRDADPGLTPALSGGSFPDTSCFLEKGRAPSCSLNLHNRVVRAETDQPGKYVAINNSRKS